MKRAQPPKPQDRRRPATRGTTRESARLETEAERAAALVDARRPVGALSAAAPAPLPNGLDPGQPLPARTRARLEAGFATDLSGLRIHTGLGAAAAAAALNADAFAAGPHLVFADGAYRPQDAQGLRLIAHETAHALQQGSGPAQRSAVPQRAPGDPGVGGSGTPKPSAGKPDLWDLLRDFYDDATYISGSKPNSDFAKDLAFMEALVRPARIFAHRNDAATANFAAKVSAKDALKSLMGKSLAFDVMQFTDENKAALAFLLVNPGIESLASTTSFISYVRANVSADLPARYFIDNPEYSPLAHRQYTGLLERLDAYITDPAAKLPTEGPMTQYKRLQKESSTDAFEQMRTRATGKKRLNINPLQWVFLTSLEQLEITVLSRFRDRKRRKEMMDNWHMPGQDTLGTSAYFDYLFRLDQMNVIFNFALKAGAPFEEAVRQRIEAARGLQIKRYLRQARHAMRAARHLLVMGRANVPMKLSEPGYIGQSSPALSMALLELAKQLKTSNPDSVTALLPLTDPKVPKLPKGDTTPAQRLARFHARLPAKDVLDTRRDALADQIAAIRGNLLTAFGKQPAPKASKDEKHLTTSGTILVALIWAEAVEAWLRSLTIADSADGRADFRYTIAIAMRAAGVVFDHPSLRLATYSVTKGSGLGESYAVILNPYKAVDKPYGDIVSDMGGNLVLSKEREITKGKGKKAKTVTIEEQLHISPRDFVRLYDIIELREMLAPLTRAIAQREALARIRSMMTPEQEKAHLEDMRKRAASDMIDPEKEGLAAVKTIDQQLEGVRTGLQVPKYYESKDSYLVIHPTDESKPHDIQLRHPSAQQFVDLASGDQTTFASWGDSYFFRDDAVRDRVYFWYVPTLLPIWFEFLKIKPIRDLIDEWRKKEKVSPDDPPDSQLIRFYHWARATGRAKTLADSYGSRLESERKDLDAKYLKLERRLSNVNRMIALDNMTDAMTIYGGSITAILLPKLFGEYISGFSRVVRPQSERTEQIALLMLQASKPIEEMLKQTHSYDAAHFLLAPVSLALTILSGEAMTQTDSSQVSPDLAKARQHSIEASFKAIDRDYKNLDADHRQLISIMSTLLKIRFQGQEKLMLVGGKDGTVFVTPSDVRLTAGGVGGAFIVKQWTDRDVTDTSEGKWDWPSEATAEAPKSADPPTGVIGTKDQYYYQIEEVRTPFQYVPSYAKEAPKSRKQGKAYSIRNDMEIDGDTVLMVVRLAKVVTKGEGDKAETRFENERIVQIRAKDDQLLDLVTSAVQVHSRGVETAKFAEDVNAGIGLILDILEFVPVVGPVIAAARLVKALIDIMRTLDWDALREDFLETPTELINLMQEDFLAKLDGDLFWWFLLRPLTGPDKAQVLINAFETIKSRSRQTEEKTRKTLNKRGRGKLLGKFVTAIKAVGPVFVNGFSNLLTQSTGGIDSALSRVSRTPLLASHLARVDQYATWMTLALDAKDAARHLSPELAAILGAKGGLGVDGIMDNILNGDAARTLGDSFRDMIAPVSKLELPDEVLPMSLLTEMIIEMSLGKVHNKKIRLVYEILRATGAISEISDFVAKNLIPDDFDPNKIWREKVVGVIEQPFKDGRDDLVKTLLSAVNAVFQFEKGAKVEIGDLPPIEVKTDAQPPATEPFLRAGDPRHPHPGLIPRDMGRPLRRELRERLQDGFGHDLSHVRLHDDPAAQAYVAATGAEALASGSHIFLGEHTDPASHDGDHILRHEVGHVLQQTGPRPLAAPGSDDARPRMGTPGGGITRHAGREAQADRMALASRERNAASDGPLPVQGQGPVSLAPFTRDDMIEVLTEMGDQARGADKTYIERVTEGPSSKLSAGGKKTIDRVEHLLTRLETEVMGAGIKWKTGWKSLDGDLKTALQGAVRKGIQNIQIGNRHKAVAARYAKRKKTFGGRKPPKNDQFDLNYQTFLNVLTGFIYDDLGVRCDFDLTGKDKSKHTAPLDISITGVHLGRLDFNKTRALYLKLKKSNPDDTKGFTFAKARAFYAARFPLPHDFKVRKKQLVLPKDERDLVAKSMTSGKTLDAMEYQGTPVTWANYINPKGDGLGLKVGTHGELTNHTKGSNTRTIVTTERESHHLPQFLLAEFYAGAHEKSAISVYGANGDYWTPGFTGGSHARNEHAKKAEPYSGFKGAGVEIDFANLTVTSKRGSGMPAVSLARDTHRKGALHLNRSLEWNPAKNDTLSTMKQSSTMLNMHRKAVIKAMKSRKSALGVGKRGGPKDMFENRRGFRAIVEHAVKHDSRRAAAEAATLEAMRATYTEFVEHMLPPLKTALSTIEKPYYARVAADTPGTMTEGDNPVFKREFEPATGDKWQSDIIKNLKDQNRRIYGAWFQDKAWS